MTPESAAVLELLTMQAIDDLPNPRRVTWPDGDDPMRVSLHNADDLDRWKLFVTIAREESEPMLGDPGWWRWEVTGRLKTAAETPVVLVASVRVERPVASVGRPA